MFEHLSSVDRHLLNDFQRGFPLVSRPFVQLGERLGLAETEVIERIRALCAEGRIARVGATVRPNTAGASTLAAMRVPDGRIDDVAAQVGALAGVNHSYLREHDWNLWFVLTAPDTAELGAELRHLRAASGLEVLDLRLVRPFNIDLGFSLDGGQRQGMSRPSVDLDALRESDRPLLHALSQGLPLTSRPWTRIGAALGWSEADVLARTAALQAAGILTRIGIIVRHRAVGWTANAMVAWSIPDDEMDAAGHALAALSGVTLCYQRRTVPDAWPYGLFSMIHGRSRGDALGILDQARALAPLNGAEHVVLFSTRCFKQTGARLERATGYAA